MKVVHQLFNSALVSGPETLVLPNLQDFPKTSVKKFVIVFLQEARLPEGSKKVAAYAKSLGHEIHEIPVSGRFDPRTVWALYRYWREHTPDLVHAHGPKASLFGLLAKYLLPKNKKPKMLTTNHGVNVSSHSTKLRFFEQFYQKIITPRFDLCVTVCSSDRDLLIKNGVPPAKIQVHLNGVDRKLISASTRLEKKQLVRESWKRDFNLPKLEGFLVGVVGRLSFEKQHMRILDAIEAIQKGPAKNKIKVLCFGVGQLAEELKQSTKNRGLDDCVLWLGYRNNVAEEMCGLDLLLSLSRAEGLPINLIEAGWSNTPVLATAVDGVRDLIEDGKSGVLLAPNSDTETVVKALLQLADDPKAVELLGHALQVRVQEKFSKTAWVASLQKVYQFLS